MMTKNLKNQNSLRFRHSHCLSKITSLKLKLIWVDDGVLIQQNYANGFNPLYMTYQYLVDILFKSLGEVTWVNIIIVSHRFD